jgi:DNA-damage-inducible protein J
MVMKARHTNEVKAKIEPELKHEVEEILEELGLSHSEIIRVFYKQIKMHRGIPFELKINTPNKETLKAIQDAENNVDMTKCENADDMFKKLGI